jgi:hypothetical protein
MGSAALVAFAVHSALLLRLGFFAKERHRVKYWIDTEFIAKPYTIDLISIGLVAEDGREFYAESSEVDWSKASLWTLENVRPQLDGKGMMREEIGYAVRQFTDGDEHPVFWGYFPAYDWVALNWLFGSMDELPFHYPQLWPGHQTVGDRTGRSGIAPPVGPPAPHAIRRSMDKGCLGISCSPRSHRGGAAGHRSQEPRPRIPTMIVSKL